MIETERLILRPPTDRDRAEIAALNADPRVGEWLSGVLTREERVVLVDADDREVGTEEKMRAHQRGVLHRAVSVFLFDDHGRLLLQRRAEGKYHSAGKWSNTCCSHPRPNCSSTQAPSASTKPGFSRRASA